MSNTGMFELAAIVAKHDPVVLARIAAQLDHKDEARRDKRTATTKAARKGRKTY